jgi:hypothetical protein
MQLVAATSGLLYMGLAVKAPTLIVLFGCSYWFSKSREQWMANIVCGFVFAVASIFAFVLCFAPTPNSWADQNFGWIVIGMAPMAAALGVAVAIGCRFAVSRRST